MTRKCSSSKDLVTITTSDCRISMGITCTCAAGNREAIVLKPLLQAIEACQKQSMAFLFSMISQQCTQQKNTEQGQALLKVASPPFPRNMSRNICVDVAQETAHQQAACIAYTACSNCESLLAPPSSGEKHRQQNRSEYGGTAYQMPVRARYQSPSMMRENSR